MNQDFIQAFFGSNVEDINLTLFCMQLLSTAILCFVVSWFYIKFGHSLSNRKALAKTFVLVGLTTMIIITIVKSSLALSLGLVGALSIVRFRTAIKEPEELAYFFMVISIGLGVGAEQVLVTLIGTIALCLIIFFIHRNRIEDVSQNLVIRFNQSTKGQSALLIEKLKTHCTGLELRRLEESETETEMSFGVSFKDLTNLMQAKEALQAEFPTVSFSFLQRV